MAKAKKKNKKGTAKKNARKTKARQPKMNKGIKSFSDDKLSDAAKFYMG